MSLNLKCAKYTNSISRKSIKLSFYKIRIFRSVFEYTMGPSYLTCVTVRRAIIVNYGLLFSLFWFTIPSIFVYLLITIFADTKNTVNTKLCATFTCLKINVIMFCLTSCRNNILLEQIPSMEILSHSQKVKFGVWNNYIKFTVRQLKLVVECWGERNCISTYLHFSDVSFYLKQYPLNCSFKWYFIYCSFKMISVVLKQFKRNSYNKGVVELRNTKYLFKVKNIFTLCFQPVDNCIFK